MPILRKILIPISMWSWVIFVLWLLITWLVNFAETVIDILKHYIFQKTVAKLFTVSFIKKHLYI